MTSRSRTLFNVLYGKVLILLSITMLSTPASARDGSDVFEGTCMKCHNPITETTGWLNYLPTDGSKEMVAVMTPRGPTLNGIVGRPAGIISNFPYSKGMRAFAATGVVWDRENLNQFLTNSRKFVKGTFMIVKLNDEDRKLVLDYLESVAIYNP